MAQPRPNIGTPKLMVDPRLSSKAKGPMVEIPKPIIQKPGAIGQKKPASDMVYPTQGSQANHYVTSKLNSIKPVK